MGHQRVEAGRSQNLTAADPRPAQQEAGRQEAVLYQAAAPVPFPLAWGWQRQLQQRLLTEPQAAAVILLEHEPCYTLGRGADPAFLRFDPADPPLPLHRIDRGGEVTHHVPGQRSEEHTV